MLYGSKGLRRGTAVHGTGVSTRCGLSRPAAIWQAICAVPLRIALLEIHRSLSVSLARNLTRTIHGDTL
jgi:hypothetical protein